MTRLASFLMAAALVLAGCGANTDELNDWMDQQKRTVKPSVQPIPAPTKFVPQPYGALSATDPFSTQKLGSGSRLEGGPANPVLTAQMRRRKQPLEAYPLDAMKMVGTVTRQGRPHALIEVDKLLHHVQVGEYIGQNYGQITRIDETELTLRELVQDAAGEWIERTTSLQLQEKAR